jgi:hypothetical protein
MINNYSDFCRQLLNAGFSVAGGNDEGIFGLINFSWDSEPPNSPIRWHTGDPETDPWEWRVRVLRERDDAAYSKVFFRKSGYITREWYPYFLAARRDGRTFKELYADGLAGEYSKRIIDVLTEYHALPVHELKQLAGFSREDKSRCDKALTDLQMNLFVTMCGAMQKRNKYGEEYGWNTMMYCLTENFWNADVIEAAAKIEKQTAIDAITERVFALNPNANAKKVRKFILG